MDGPVSILTDQERLIYDGVMATNQSVNNGTLWLQSQLQLVDQKIENQFSQINSKLNKKAARSHIEYRELLCQNDGEYVLLQIYSDGAQRAKPFIHQKIGGYRIADIYIDYAEKVAEYFLVEFSCVGIQIIGSKRKLSSKILYDEFLKAGIKFDQSFSKTQVMEILYENFAPRINQPNERIIISSRAGWDGNTFRDFFTYPLKIKDAQTFPVYKKRFLRQESVEEHYRDYFADISGIAEDKNRVSMAILPFAGMLASWLIEVQNPIQNAWNFVVMSDVSDSQIASGMQIFNREHWEIHDMDMSSKELKMLLSESKDEVILGDFRSVPTETFYRHKKKLELLEAVYKRVKLEKLPIVFASISDNVVLKNGFINIFLDEDFFCTEREKVSEEKPFIGAIMADFIRYAEHFYGSLRGKTAEWSETGMSGLEVVWKLMVFFFNSRGYDLYQQLGVPRDFSFEKIEQPDEWCTEDILSAFVRGFRKVAGEYYFAEKGYGVSYDFTTTIAFDENHLWIPTSIFREILRKSGMYKFRHQILLELKERRFLKTDGSGFSRKLNAGNRSCESYQIAKKIFNVIGFCDIADCGKEAEGCGIWRAGEFN